MKRRTSGKETWHRLLDWDRSSGDAERLAAQVLALEGYGEIDPSHPLGGRDGKRDIMVSKKTKSFVVGVYFPRGKKLLREIKKKYQNDAEGVDANEADGYVFFTNQELTLSEREELQNLRESDLYHLERVTQTLNQPKAYGVRLEFLDIDMTKEEILSTLAVRDAAIEKLEQVLRKYMESAQAEDHSQHSSNPVEVVPQSLNSDVYSITGGLGNRLHFCSSCGYGYKIADSQYDRWTTVSFSLNQKYSVTCPKCQNTEYYNDRLGLGL